MKCVEPTYIMKFMKIFITATLISLPFWYVDVLFF